MTLETVDTDIPASFATSDIVANFYHLSCFRSLQAIQYTSYFAFASAKLVSFSILSKPYNFG